MVIYPLYMCVFLFLGLSALNAANPEKKEEKISNPLPQQLIVEGKKQDTPLPDPVQQLASSFVSAKVKKDQTPSNPPLQQLIVEGKKQDTPSPDPVQQLVSDFVTEKVNNVSIKRIFENFSPAEKGKFYELLLKARDQNAHITQRMQTLLHFIAPQPTLEKVPEPLSHKKVDDIPSLKLPDQEQNPGKTIVPPGTQSDPVELSKAFVSDKKTVEEVVEGAKSLSAKEKEDFKNYVRTATEGLDDPELAIKTVELFESLESLPLPEDKKEKKARKIAADDKEKMQSIDIDPKEKEEKLAKLLIEFIEEKESLEEVIKILQKFLPEDRLFFLDHLAEALKQNKRPEVEQQGKKLLQILQKEAETNKDKQHAENRERLLEEIFEHFIDGETTPEEVMPLIKDFPLKDYASFAKKLKDYLAENPKLSKEKKESIEKLLSLITPSLVQFSVQKRPPLPNLRIGGLGLGASSGRRRGGGIRAGGGGAFLDFSSFSSKGKMGKKRGQKGKKTTPTQEPADKEKEGLLDPQPPRGKPLKNTGLFYEVDKGLYILQPRKQIVLELIEAYLFKGGLQSPKELLIPYNPTGNHWGILQVILPDRQINYIDAKPLANIPMDIKVANQLLIRKHPGSSFKISFVSRKCPQHSLMCPFPSHGSILQNKVTGEITIKPSTAGKKGKKRRKEKALENKDPKM